MKRSYKIILVGGGHCHSLFLKLWAKNPMPDVQLTLISRDVLTPYSGMLPGFVAGHYSHKDIHINLAQLCAWSNVEFIEDEMIGINLDSKRVDIPGSDPYTTPVKPVYSFISRWNEILNSNASQIGVVGAGAGGYELVMAMAYKLRNSSISVHWFLRGDSPMSDRPEKVGIVALECAQKAGIQIHTGFNVERVEEGYVTASDGRSQQFEQLLWCTAATAPEWPKNAGLELDARGFVATDQYLQSRSHPDVFATGDIGTQIDTPSAKAGVFAVRQAPFLFHNVRAKLEEKSLRAYIPQKDFLSLVSTGRKHAIGSRSGFTFSGRWVWYLKHAIDSEFMNKFAKLSG